MAKQIKANEAAAARPAVVIFGLDEGKRSHAAWFGEADAELAEKAAALMAMSVLKITNDQHRAVAAELPAGRVFASGKAFAPFCAGGTYDRLTAFEGAYKPEPPVVAADPLPQHSNIPATWSEIGQGSLVLAADGEEGAWYEATVVEAKADLFGLRWCRWPQLPPIVRRREHLSLMSAAAHQAVAEASAPTEISSAAS